MVNNSFDLVVIGSGPGGYVAAIRAAQLGLKVACVDKRGKAGGTCLNVGCIPSKALLQSSEKYYEAKYHLAEHGVKADTVTLELEAMLGRKDDVVKGLNQGVSLLFKKNKVEEIHGTARLLGTGKVKVNDSDAERVLSTKNILIATGSEPMPLQGVVVDEHNVVSSSGALSLSKVPEHLVVIGAGYIGLEMASVWRRLGAEVTVVEFLDRITPNMDAETSSVLQQSLEKQGIKFRLRTRVVGTAKRDSETIVSLEPENGSRVEEIGCEVVLLAIGRQPFTTGLGLEEVGVRVNARGFIEVDDKFETSVSRIFAIGDVIPGPMLAHKAEEEAVVAVEMMVGQSGHVNYKCIPSVIYTAPEVASVGLSEEELKESGIGYRSGKFPFLANSRARSSGLDQAGFVKILVDEKVDTIVGAHIIGPDAGTLIGELTLAMEFSASAEDVARTCHAHPTLNEAIKEAALAACSQPIHF